MASDFMNASGRSGRFVIDSLQTNRASRTHKAAARIAAARRSLGECRLCAHECGVNRFDGPAGRCHAGIRARVFQAQTEVSDELMLSPTFAIALSGCDIRCDFCITGRESWNSKAGQPLDISHLVQEAARALAGGARSIMILGGEPTIHLPTVLEIVAALPEAATLVWKTNGHGTHGARLMLEGLFDVWVVDYKFGNDQCALRLAQVPDYTEILRQNLLWAHANTDLIVRHLVMPGHLECCWRPVAEWLALETPGVKINLRTGFWPAWRAHKHLELRATVAPNEAAEAVRYARSLDLNLID